MLHFWNPSPLLAVFHSDRSMNFNVSDHLMHYMCMHIEALLDLARISHADKFVINVILVAIKFTRPRKEVLHKLSQL